MLAYVLCLSVLVVGWWDNNDNKGYKRKGKSHSNIILLYCIEWFWIFLLILIIIIIY